MPTQSIYGFPLVDPYLWPGAASLGPFALNASNNAVGVIFQAEAGRGNIAGLGVLCTAVTSPPTYRASLQGVSSRFNPDGSIKGSGACVVTFTPTANTVHALTFGAAYAASVGNNERLKVTVLIVLACLLAIQYAIHDGTVRTLRASASKSFLEASHAASDHFERSLALEERCDELEKQNSTLSAIAEGLVRYLNLVPSPETSTADPVAGDDDEDLEERVGYDGPHPLPDAFCSGVPRSPEWRAVRDRYFSEHPYCEFPGCSCQGPFNVHHRKPYHLFRELELEPSNLVTLCAAGVDADGNKSPNHHLYIGHLGNYRDCNMEIETALATGQWPEKGQRAFLESQRKKAAKTAKTLLAP